MFITFKLNHFAPQVNYADLFVNISAPISSEYSHKFYRTFTKEVDYETASSTYAEQYKIPQAMQNLIIFHEKITPILQDNMQSLYSQFHIPKATGGLRTIDAPNNELKALQTELKNIFEFQFHCLAHDAAFAYVRGRSTKEALMEHQKNESRWFLKIDIKDFFPSCSLLFIMKQLERVFPFGTLLKHSYFKQVISDCIKLCLINDKLPQGTPMSPILTNLIMIPLDVKIKDTFRDFAGHNFKYTRYADDILLSCKYHFKWEEVQAYLDEILKHDSPFEVKRRKTRYGSISGKNWNLGLMLNKDNNITIGWKKKERFRASINNFLFDFKKENYWSLQDVYILSGMISYYNKIEPEYTEDTLQKYSQKYNLSVRNCIKDSITM